MTNCSAICQPPNTEKVDYTQSPSADLGTTVFWGQPSFAEGKGSGLFWGRRVVSAAHAERSDRGRGKRSRMREWSARRRLTMYFFSEVTLSMSTSPLRAAMVPVIRQMRAYFAPVNRATETPTIFDPGQSGAFPLDSPPAPWLDLGWIENFARWYDDADGRGAVRSEGAAGSAISRAAGGASGV